MSAQQKIKELLGKAGIAHKEIQVYGSQIVVTCWCEDAAKKFSDVIAKFANIRGIIKSLDENKDNEKRINMKKYHEVYRVFATI